MTILPINVGDESFLIIIIERENLDRMREADPITLESKTRGGQILARVANPHNLSIVIAYEEDEVELYKLLRAGDAAAILRYVERGRKWNPETDGPENIVSFGKGEL